MRNNNSPLPNKPMPKVSVRLAKAGMAGFGASGERLAQSPALSQNAVGSEDCRKILETSILPTTKNGGYP